MPISTLHQKFKELLSEAPRLKKGGCSMCGDKFCALKVYS